MCGRKYVWRQRTKSVVRLQKYWVTSKTAGSQHFLETLHVFLSFLPNRHSHELSRWEQSKRFLGDRWKIEVCKLIASYAVNCAIEGIVPALSSAERHSENNYEIIHSRSDFEPRPRVSFNSRCLAVLFSKGARDALLTRVTESIRACRLSKRGIMQIIKTSIAG